MDKWHNCTQVRCRHGEPAGGDDYEYPYEAPRYDPFEVFEPAKNLISVVVTRWKQECMALLEAKRNLESEFLFDFYDTLHQKLLSNIRRYQVYLNDVPMNGNKEEALRHPIITLVQNQVRRVNGRYLMKCPFHNDSTPSFVIYPNNTYYCFGCQESGDAISFVRKLHNLNFKEAIEYLTHKA